jgi:hypothetical protein
MGSSNVYISRGLIDEVYDVQGQELVESIVASDAISGNPRFGKISSGI